MNAFRSAVQIKNYLLIFAQRVPHDKFKRCEMSFDVRSFRNIFHNVSTKRSKRDPVLLLLRTILNLNKANYCGN
jgi:hypothetical protein